MLKTLFGDVIVTIVENKVPSGESLSSIHLIFIMICTKLLKSSLVIKRDVSSLETGAEVKVILPVVLVVDAGVGTDGDSDWYIHSMGISDYVKPLSFELRVLTRTYDSEVMLTGSREKIGVLQRILSIFSLYIRVPFSNVAKLVEDSVFRSNVNENRGANFDLIVYPGCELVSD